MSETIALEKTKQSRFTKKVKNVKSRVSKGIIKVQDDFKKQKLNKIYGLIYIGHIPHGFYEEQMEEYFKQFGKVTNVLVSRSKKTGQSKGYGFVQFSHPEVAQIAAETMDNYLMFNRRIVCKYIPPEKQRKYIFTKERWSVKNFPLKVSRRKHIAERNRNPSEEQFKETAKTALKKLKKKINKLAALGVEHTFKPSDVPDDMQHLLSAENNDKLLEVEKVNPKRNVKDIASKSLKSIVKKKDKVKKKVSNISFMQNDRIKRLAAKEMLNEDLVKKINKIKKI